MLVMVWALSITAIIIVLAIAVIVLLPVVIRARFNRKLNSLDDFTGHVTRVRINLFTRKLNVYDIRVERRAAPAERPPVIFIPHLYIGFQWPALRHMQDLIIVAYEPRVVIVAEPGTYADPLPTPGKEPANVKSLLGKLPAFHADIEVQNGYFQYIGPVADVRADIPVTALNLYIHSLTNRSIPKHITPIEATANVFDGRVVLHANLLPLAETLTFAATAEVLGVNLVMLKNFLRRYI
jgi:hypothetical protein